MSIKQKMEDARYLIQTKRYDEARVILQGIKHPIAEKWLQKINTMSGSDPAPKPKKRKKKKSESTLPWLQGMEDLSQAQGSDTLSFAEDNAIFEKVKEAKAKDKTHSNLWQDKTSTEDEGSPIPGMFMGGVLGAVVGAAVWTGAVIGLLLWMNDFFGVEGSAFTMFATMGGVVIGAFVGVTARLFSGRGSFYGGLLVALWAVLGVVASKIATVILLVNVDMGITSTEQGSAALGGFLANMNNPLLINPINDGIAVATGALVAWAIASSLGGVLE